DVTWIWHSNGCYHSRGSRCSLDHQRCQWTVAEYLSRSTKGSGHRYYCRRRLLRRGTYSRAQRETSARASTPIRRLRQFIESDTFWSTIRATYTRGGAQGFSYGTPIALK